MLGWSRKLWIFISRILWVSIRELLANTARGIFLSAQRKFVLLCLRRFTVTAQCRRDRSCPERCSWLFRNLRGWSCPGGSSSTPPSWVLAICRIRSKWCLSATAVRLSVVGSLCSCLASPFRHPILIWSRLYRRLRQRLSIWLRQRLSIWLRPFIPLLLAIGWRSCRFQCVKTRISP